MKDNPEDNYLVVYLLVLILLGLSVGSTFLPLGAGHVAIVLLLALAQAWLVVFFFMRVRFGTELVRIMVSASLFWFAVLFFLMMSDYGTRTWSW